MIVCDSSAQAKEVFKQLSKYEDLSKALILHDEDDTLIREEERKAFIRGEIDIVVVYNMLLTGFDAPRLKKQYLGRVIKAHNLLQTLTRVNRPYKDFRYGYVVDFANIKDEFDKTNRAYFNELQAELGDEFEKYSNIFKDKEEIESDIQEIKDKLFLFDIKNMENFSKQITSIEDKNKLIEIRRALESYKALYNIIRLLGYDELLNKLDLVNADIMYNEVNRKINIINLKEQVKNSEDVSGILNLALDQIDFHFTKVKQEELIIADKFREMLEKARHELSKNLDPKDKEFVSLLEELKRIFKKKNIEELNAVEMAEEIENLEKIKSKAQAINQRDQLLCEKYDCDSKYLRAHKRIMESPPPISNDRGVFGLLSNVKETVDDIIVNNERLLDNEAYFSEGLKRIVINSCKQNQIPFTIDQIKLISILIANEYFRERSCIAC
jgi:type I restriction enzyme R subunit